MIRGEQTTLLSSTYNRANRWAAFLPQDISQVEGGYAAPEDEVTDDISEQIKHGRVFSAGQL